MTLADLHQIKDFAALFDDPRFVALCHYMREHIGKIRNIEGSSPEVLIARGFHREGWLDAINTLPDQRNAPAPDQTQGQGRRPLYSDKQ